MLSCSCVWCASDFLVRGHPLPVPQFAAAITIIIIIIIIIVAIIIDNNHNNNDDDNDNNNNTRPSGRRPAAAEQREGYQTASPGKPRKAPAPQSPRKGRAIEKRELTKHCVTQEIMKTP